MVHVTSLPDPELLLLGFNLLLKPSLPRNLLGTFIHSGDTSISNVSAVFQMAIFDIEAQKTVSDQIFSSLASCLFKPWELLDGPLHFR